MEVLQHVVEGRRLSRLSATLSSLILGWMQPPPALLLNLTLATWSSYMISHSIPQLAVSRNLSGCVIQ